MKITVGLPQGDPLGSVILGWLLMQFLFRPLNCIYNFWCLGRRCIADSTGRQQILPAFNAIALVLTVL